MARITKEIKEAIQEWEEAEQGIEHYEHLRWIAFQKLLRLGMTPKQLQDRDIYDY